MFYEEYAPNDPKWRPRPHENVRNAYFVDLYVFYDGFDDLAGQGSSRERG